MANVLIIIEAIGERLSSLDADDVALREFRGTEDEALTWIKGQFRELGGSTRATTIPAAVAAWNRSGFADEWEMRFRLIP